MSPFLVITVILSVFYFALVLYFFTGWVRTQTYERGANKFSTFVSILLPVRNEEDNLRACLNAIFNQHYPIHLFEVIVIDDYSFDSTLRIAREFNHKNIVVLDLKNYLGAAGEYTPNKKKAISIGVKNARGEVIVTTDGDCVMDEHWLETMVSFYKEHDYKLITGPVLLKPATFLLGAFQQIDMINMVGITGATIRNGFPTMCNAANLLYDKEAFLAVDGYKGNSDIPTGDDVFLLHKINDAYPDSIGFVKSMDACVYSKPETNLNGFIAQRVRWISKSTRFKHWKVTVVLLFSYLFNLQILINLLLATQATDLELLLPAIVALSVKLFVDFLFNVTVTNFFRRKALLFLFPIFESLHVFYLVVIGVFGLTGKYRWKDRAVGWVKKP